MERMRNQFAKYDQNLFYKFNGLQELMITFFRGVTHLGGATFTISALLFVFFISQPSSQLRITAILSIFSLTVSHLLVQGVKRFVRRIRPYLALPDVIVYGHPFKDHSFPSGHSTAAFAIATPFMIQYPFLIMLLLPLSSLIAISRVVLGVHYPSDAIVGSFLGIVTSVIFYLFAY
jgi:undecaprenyl-diphosphatase